MSNKPNEGSEVANTDGSNIEQNEGEGVTEFKLPPPEKPPKGLSKTKLKKWKKEQKKKRQKLMRKMRAQQQAKKEENEGGDFTSDHLQEDASKESKPEEPKKEEQEEKKEEPKKSEDAIMDKPPKGLNKTQLRKWKKQQKHKQEMMKKQQQEQVKSEDDNTAEKDGEEEDWMEGGEESGKKEVVKKVDEIKITEEYVPERMPKGLSKTKQKKWKKDEKRRKQLWLKTKREEAEKRARESKQEPEQKKEESSEKEAKENVESNIQESKPVASEQKSEDVEEIKLPPPEKPPKGLSKTKMKKWKKDQKKKRQELLKKLRAQQQEKKKGKQTTDDGFMSDLVDQESTQSQPDQQKKEEKEAKSKKDENKTTEPKQKVEEEKEEEGEIKLPPPEKPPKGLSKTKMKKWKKDQKKKRQELLEKLRAQKKQKKPTKEDDNVMNELAVVEKESPKKETPEKEVKKKEGGKKGGKKGKKKKKGGPAALLAMKKKMAKAKEDEKKRIEEEKRRIAELERLEKEEEEKRLRGIEEQKERDKIKKIQKLDEKQQKKANQYLLMLKKQNEELARSKREADEKRKEFLRIKEEKRKVREKEEAIQRKKKEEELRKQREEEEVLRKQKEEEEKKRKEEEEKERQKKLAEEEGEGESEEDFDDFIDELDSEDDEYSEEEEKREEEERKRKKKEEEKRKKDEKMNHEGGDEQKKSKKLSKKEKREIKKKEEEERRMKKETQQRSKAIGLRSPICCVLGHVDTGKTKILDYIRKTKVQDREAGGITQQIGATYIPIDSIKKRIKGITKNLKLKFKVPGLLIIDTPGHEAFTNLRSRGSSLCDIAILIVDIMHGIEQQTVESINLLKKRKRPFVVALNKIDQLNEWEPHIDMPIQETLKLQKKHTVRHFRERVEYCKMNFQQHGLNSCMYYKNKDFKKYISLVPTSAHTGEGLPDLLTLMTQLTQNLMVKRITYKSNLQCTILESKYVSGHGHTVDVILSNGILQSSDTIVVCTLNGAVVTPIRSLLTPKPLKEIRVKGEWVKHKFVRASQGIKIAAPNLEGAVAGTPILVLKEDDDVEELKDKVMEDLEEVMQRITTSGLGCHVQASTLGSLEALLDELKGKNVPISGCSIGPVHKKDVAQALSMLEQGHPEFAVILAFDVKITKDAEIEARKSGVTVFRADIIYHLVERWEEHQLKMIIEKKREIGKKTEVVWPCILRVRPLDVFRTSKPCVLGIDVVKGVLKVNTPIMAVLGDGKTLNLGRVENIQQEKNSMEEAPEGKAVAISFGSKSPMVYGKHFDDTHKIVSKISRRSIDTLKHNFKEELEADDKKLLRIIVELKRDLNIL